MELEVLNVEIEGLKDEINLLKGKLLAKGPVYESQQLGDLFTALAKAQDTMEIAKTDAANPFFKSKYADLASIVRASRKHLSSNGLCITQRILPNGDGNTYLYTRLGHASGQWMESKMMIDPSAKNVQSTGSSITYLRRYTYAAICGVVADDEDDDGEHAVKDNRKQVSDDKPLSDKISKAQLQVLSQQLEGMEDVLESLLTSKKLGKLSDLLAKDYTSCMNKIRDIKRAKEA